MKLLQIIYAFLIISVPQSCGNNTKEHQQIEPKSTIEEKSISKTVIKKNLPIPLKLSELPSDIKYEGKITKAFKWTDNLGKNIVITSETGIYDDKKFKHENDGRDAAIFAYHFVVKGKNAQQSWKIYD